MDNSRRGTKKNKINNNNSAGYTKRVPRQNYNRSAHVEPKVKKRRMGIVARILRKLFGRDKTVIELTRYREGVDRIFLILIIIMLCLGTVMIFSASYANALQYYGDSYFFAKKQLMMAGLGLLAMIVMSYIADYAKIKKLALPFFFGTLALNYATGIWGKITHGATRWIIIFGIQFQPSELLKLAAVIFFAYYIARVGDKMKTWRWGIILPMLVVGSIVGAMWLQSHISGLIILGLICVVVMFIGEAPLGFFAICGSVIVAVVIFIRNYTQVFADLLIKITHKAYAADRILAWIDPFKFPKDEGYQTIQSLYAIGSGGLTGLGWGQSRQKYLFLPEPQNDFIFSVICEEMGFIGALIIIVLFILLIWRGFVIAYHAPNKFASVVVMGITSKVAIQFLLNIAVVTNTIPNTGISLPFFSYGGTALIVLMAEMGIILSISRYSYQEKP